MKGLGGERIDPKRGTDWAATAPQNRSPSATPHTSRNLVIEHRMQRFADANADLAVSLSTPNLRPSLATVGYQAAIQPQGDPALT
jgi:hypothetical protein